MANTVFKFDNSDEQITNMESLLEEASMHEYNVLVCSDGDYTYVQVEGLMSTRFDAHKVRVSLPCHEEGV